MEKKEKRKNERSKGSKCQAKKNFQKIPLMFKMTKKKIIKKMRKYKFFKNSGFQKKK